MRRVNLHHLLPTGGAEVARTSTVASLHRNLTALEDARVKLVGVTQKKGPGVGLSKT